MTDRFKGRGDDTIQGPEQRSCDFSFFELPRSEAEQKERFLKAVKGERNRFLFCFSTRSELRGQMSGLV